MTDKITEKQVVELMTTATTSVTTMRESVQNALVGLVQHAAESGDKRLIMTKAVEWIKAMSGVNMKACVEYLVKFGGVKLAAGGFVNDKGVQPDLIGALKCQWWTLKPQQAFRGFDLGEEISKLIKRAEKAEQTASEEGKENMVKCSTLEMGRLRDMVQRLQNVDDAAGNAVEGETDPLAA